MTIRELLSRQPQLEPAIRTFYRALPQLLADPEVGRYIVVHESELCGTWDTYRDALQHGLSRFEPGTFLVQSIDSRLLDPLAEVFGSVDVPGTTSCPA